MSNSTGLQNDRQRFIQAYTVPHQRETEILGQTFEEAIFQIDGVAASLLIYLVRRYSPSAYLPLSSDIARLVNKRPSQISEAFKQLVGIGEVIKVKQKSGRHKYRLNPELYWDKSEKERNSLISQIKEFLPSSKENLKNDYQNGDYSNHSANSTPLAFQRIFICKDTDGVEGNSDS